LAAGLDHILGAVGDLHRAAGVDDGDVAGVEPAFGVDAIALVVLEIALDNPGPAHLETAGAFPVARLRLALVIDHPKLDAERHPALLLDQIELFLEAHLLPAGGRRADRADRRGLGHSPGMADA